MYANVATLRYKSREAGDQAVEKLKHVSESLPEFPGFHSFALVRTGDTESVHMGRFESEENARNAREQVGPRIMEALADYLEGQPDVRHGPVPVVREPHARAPAP